MFFFPAATVCKHNLIWDGEKSENSISFKFSQQIFQILSSSLYYLSESVPLFSQRSSFYISAAVMWKHNISKMSILHESVKKKSETLLKSYISFGSVQTRGERWSSPALQKSSSDTRELRLEDT